MDIIVAVLQRWKQMVRGEQVEKHMRWEFRNSVTVLQMFNLGYECNHVTSSLIRASRSDMISFRQEQSCFNNSNQAKVWCFGKKISLTVWLNHYRVLYTYTNRIKSNCSYTVIINQSLLAAIQDLHDVISKGVPRIGMGIQNQFQLRTRSKLSKSPESYASGLTNSFCQCWQAF